MIVNIDDNQRHLLTAFLSTNAKFPNKNSIHTTQVFLGDKTVFI